mmetsp:Transcript_121698/g.234704  ORF Transcript_121698/g.234704 Transcript_121698/m.234704 type:complete len:148 (+) Transcript_121698:133-576(+)
MSWPPRQEHQQIPQLDGPASICRRDSSHSHPLALDVRCVGYPRAHNSSAARSQPMECVTPLIDTSPQSNPHQQRLAILVGQPTLPTQPCNLVMIKRLDNMKTPRVQDHHITILNLNGMLQRQGATYALLCTIGKKLGLCALQQSQIS